MKMRKKLFVRQGLLLGLISVSFSAHAFWLFGNHSQTDTTNQPTRRPAFNINEETQVLHSQAPNLNEKVLKLALKAYDNAAEMRYPVRKPVLTVIDYSLPDSEKRLWVFDLKRQKLLYNTFVAHGQGSGGLYAERFSNQNGTHASSIGVFLTEAPYYGSKGYALRLDGLDKGFNDHAASRDIVMHGAWYVNPQFAHSYGHIGRSWGCPSIPLAMVKPIVNTIKEGSLIFAYAPKFSWLHESRFLNN